MKTIKGPGIFLAQFIGPRAPFNTPGGDSAVGRRPRGTRHCRSPATTRRFLMSSGRRRARPTATRSAASPAEHGLVISELSTHLEGQLVAVHPAYDAAFDAFAPAALHGDPQARQRWAVEKVRRGGGSLRPPLGLQAHATFSGALAWPFFLSVAAAQSAASG